MQKVAKPDSGLKRLWRAVASSGEEGETAEASGGGGLPLLQVWPSQDSPRGEADGQSFVFPPEDATDQKTASTAVDPPQVKTVAVSACASPVPSFCRRGSSQLLHPEHARLMTRTTVPPLSPSLSLDHTHSGDDVHDAGLTSGSSSVSSLNSIAPGVASRAPDAQQDGRRRRSSTLTARYSMFDALDLEYALVRAAARGSVGPCSLSHSLQKLSFTQSLAFPALARGLNGNRRSSSQCKARRPLDPHDSGLNIFAKVITALLLVLVSMIVFGIVYKYVHT